MKILQKFYQLLKGDNSITEVQSEQKNKDRVTTTSKEKKITKSKKPENKSKYNFRTNEIVSFLSTFIGNQSDMPIYANNHIEKMDKIYGFEGLELEHLKTSALEEYVKELGGKQDIKKLVRILQFVKENRSVPYAGYASGKAIEAIANLGPVGSFIGWCFDIESDINKMQDLSNIVNDLLVLKDFKSIIPLLDIVKNKALPVKLRIAAVKNIPDKDVTAIEIFKDILKTKPPEKLKEILTAYIGVSNEASVDDIFRIIEESDDITTVSNAVDSLKELNDSRAIEPLIKMIKDKPDNWEGLKREAFEIIGKLKDPIAVEHLISLLGETDYYLFITSDALKALKAIGSPSVEPLIKVFKDSEDDYVRKCVAEALGDIGDPKAVDQLIKTLEENYDEEDSTSDFRRASLYGLFQLKEHIEDFTEILINSLERDNDPTILMHVIRGLGDIGDSRAVDALIKSYSKDCIEDKWWITIALSQIGDQDAIEQIRKICSKDADLMPPNYSWLNDEIEICEKYLGNLEDYAKEESVPKFRSVVCLKCGSYLNSSFELFKISEDEVYCEKGEFMGGEMNCEKCGEKYEVHFHKKKLRIQRPIVDIDDDAPSEKIFNQVNE